MALVVAPFALGFGAHPAALWSSVLFGAAVTVMSILNGLLRDRMPCEYRVIGLLSVLVAGSPFVLGFTTIPPALLVNTILGIGAFALCVYQIFYAEARNP